MPVLMPPNELERLSALRQTTDALGSTDLRRLHRLATMAARALRTEFAAVTLVERTLNRFIAVHEFEHRALSRDQFFCAYAILTEHTFAVLDASRDPRFNRMAVVAGEPFLRFYAGVPIHGGGGDVIGTLCVFDSERRTAFGEDEREMLVTLARETEAEMSAHAAGSQTVRPWLAGSADANNPPPTPVGGEARVHEYRLPSSTPADERAVLSHTPFRNSRSAVDALEEDFTPFIDRDEEARGATAAMAAQLNGHPELLQQIIDSNPNPVFIKDRDDCFVMVNAAGAALFGRSIEQMIGQRESDISVGKREREEITGDFERVTTAVQHSVVNHEPREEEFIDSEGRKRWFQVRRQSLGTDAIGPKYILTIAADITALKAAELREEGRRNLTRIVSGPERIETVLLNIAEYVEDHINGCLCFVWTRRGEELNVAYTERAPGPLAARVVGVSTAAEKIPLIAGDERHRPIYSGRIQENAFAQPYLEQAQRAGHQFLVSYPICNATGSVLGVVDVLSREPITSGQSGRDTISAATDLAAIAVEQRRRQSMLSYQAQYDPLTHLPNRYELEARVHRALGHARRHGQMIGLLYIDLDRFKQVNDTLGHSVGDALLREVAGRFETCLRTTDTLARMGGDEFAAVLTELNDTAGATRVAQKLMASLHRPFEIANFSLVVTTTIGIAMYPNDGSDAGTLLRNADAALYRAKEHERGTFRFFAPDIHDNALERLELETALREAVQNRDLRMFLQPQHDLATGQTVGFESLARWSHPRLGVISPAKFIPLAEETRMISDIGIWALEETCRAARYWHEMGGHPVSFGVNVSPVQLVQDDFVSLVARAVDIFDLAPGTLELEITENAMMKDVDAVVPKLHRLRELGVRISIDDFGTGYSSLAYLQRLPVDRVKIDRAFVADLDDSSVGDPANVRLLRAIVDMAHTLGFDVVAEGVETEVQVEFLRGIGCEVAQGYLYARPQAARATMDRALSH